MSARCWFLIAQWVSGRERSRVKRLANNHARIRRGLYLELTSCNGCENSQSFLHFTSESAFVPLKMAAQFRLGISHLVWKIARRTHRGIFRGILFMCFNAHICRSYLLRSLANCFVCATQPQSDATEVRHIKAFLYRQCNTQMFCLNSPLLFIVHERIHTY